MELLTRTEFRNGVFGRDRNRCVMCWAEAQDAHHILERRLFPDGGYYLNNGASLCGPCHIAAESTRISVEEIRFAAGIEDIVLPPHLYSDAVYDKWGNQILENGQRLRGELFYDGSVQKALRIKWFSNDIDLVFSKRVKYPRTYHLPWSPTPSKDDRTMPDVKRLEGRRVIVTEKMDGENTTMYDDGIHARSVDGRTHPSRDWVKNFWADKISYQIPSNFRICGENMYAEHSIHYTDLPGYFLGFGIWVDDVLMGWDDTLEWFELLDIPPVPVLFDGIWLPGQDAIPTRLDMTTQEGYVLRDAGPIAMREWPTRVGKWVRNDHVQTTKHWMHGQPIIPNELEAL